MKLPRRKFLHLAAGAATLPAVSRIAWAQAYPTRRSGQGKGGRCRRDCNLPRPRHATTPTDRVM